MIHILHNLVLSYIVRSRVVWKTGTFGWRISSKEFRNGGGFFQSGALWSVEAIPGQCNNNVITLQIHAHAQTHNMNMPCNQKRIIHTTCSHITKTDTLGVHRIQTHTHELTHTHTYSHTHKHRHRPPHKHRNAHTNIISHSSGQA